MMIDVVFLMFTFFNMLVYFYHFTHILQLEDYSYLRMLKKIKNKFSFLLESLVFVVGIIFLILYIMFDSQTIRIILLSIFTLINLLKTINFLIKNKNSKISLKITNRVKRFGIVFIFTCLVSITFMFMTKSLYLIYVFTIIFNILYLISYVFSLPVEKINYCHFMRKAVNKLRSFKNLKIIAITGSYGKTSVKNILYEMLVTKYNVLKSPASYNTPMGICRTILEYLKPYHEVLILEFGAKKKGEIRYLCKKFKPSYGILTNIGKQHLDTFKSFDNIISTKKELQENLYKHQLMVFNLDNVYVKKVSENFDKCCKYVASLIESNNAKPDENIVNISNVKVDEKGSVFSLSYDGCVSSFSTKLLGLHNITNIALSFAMAKFLNVEDLLIQSALNHLDVIPHRLEKKVFNDKIILDNSYNSNPVSAKCAFDTLALFEGRKKVVVTPGIVEQGKEMYRENYLIGYYASKVADEMVVVNRINRKAITNGLFDGGFDFSNVKYADEFKDIDFNKYNDNEVILLENDLPDNYL